MTDLSIFSEIHVAENDFACIPSLKCLSRLSRFQRHFQFFYKSWWMKLEEHNYEILDGGGGRGRGVSPLEKSFDIRYHLKVLWQLKHFFSIIIYIYLYKNYFDDIISLKIHISVQMKKAIFSIPILADMWTNYHWKAIKKRRQASNLFQMTIDSWLSKVRRYETIAFSKNLKKIDFKPPW